MEKRWLCVECREEAKRDRRWRGIRMKDIVASLFYVRDKGEAYVGDEIVVHTRY